MNNFFKSVVLLILSVFAVSCSKSDSSSEPLRDYATQRDTDMANIETYMKSYYMEVVNNPGAPNDQSVIFTKIPTGGTQVSIWDQTTYPIQTHYVLQNDIVYKIYYLQLRQGTGADAKSPCNVDNVLTSYRGEYIYNGTEGIISKQFEEKVTPIYAKLAEYIKGWGEIFPKFKTGDYVGNPDGSISYTNFGAGVMFIPSGLAYYSGSTTAIPAYSPLIFGFKVYEVSRADTDGDGIPSYQEDFGTAVVNSDGTVTYSDGPDGYVRKLETGVKNPDNTNAPGTATVLPWGDGTAKSKEDEIPDYLDPDDDGDYFLTIIERKYINPADLLGTKRYYPYEGAATDDPTTPYVDETKGVPDCSNDYTSPSRLRKYRDPHCH